MTTGLTSQRLNWAVLWLALFTGQCVVWGSERYEQRKRIPEPISRRGYTDSSTSASANGFTFIFQSDCYRGSFVGGRVNASQAVREGTSQPILADSVPKAVTTSLLSVTVRLVDSETSEPISTAKLVTTDDQTQQTLTPVVDSLDHRFILSVAPGTSLSFLAAAPGYVSTRARLTSLNAPRQIILKLMKLKPSVLTIKAFSMTIRQPLTSAVVVITSRTTGKAERFTLSAGRLERTFVTPDDLDIQISAVGYTAVSRRLTIDVPPSGKRYELDAELDKITLLLTVRVVDNQTGKAISSAQLTVTANKGGRVISFEPDPATGLATANVPGRGTYQLTTRVEGYSAFSQSLVLDKEQNEVLVKLAAKPPVADTKSLSTSEIESMTTTGTAALSLSLVTTKPFGVIEKGKHIRLNKIYFDQSSPVLRPESYTELDQLFDVLTQYPSLQIEIRGHTDNQGDFDLNSKLSHDRCQAVVEYLMAKGIQKNRLKAVGRGSLDPVAPNTNEQNRRKNRRVEFVVL